MFAYWIVTLCVPTGVLFATLRVAFSVPPGAPAGVIPVSVMPVTAGLVIVALVTVPSGSVALTPAEVATP